MNGKNGFALSALLGALMISNTAYTSDIAQLEEGIRRLIQKGEQFEFKNSFGSAYDRLSSIVPDSAEFANLVFKHPTMTAAPAGMKNGFVLEEKGLPFGLSGNQKVDVKLLATQDISNNIQISLQIDFPSGWKLAGFLPDLKNFPDIMAFFNAVSLTKSKLVHSTFAYTDTSFNNVEIKPGLNYIASLQLEGPLAFFRTLQDTMKQGLQVRSGDITFQGVIPKSGFKPEFSATIPYQFGLDLRAVKDIPQEVSSVFNKFQTGAWTLRLQTPNVLSLSTGLDLYFNNGSTPLSPKIGGQVIISKSPTFSAFAALNQSVEFEWGALGDLGIQLDWNQKLLPEALAMGIPFTGIGMRGSLYFGAPSAANKAKIDVVGGATFGDSSNSGLLFKGSAQNINLADIITHFGYLMQKSGEKLVSPLSDAAITPQMFSSSAIANFPQDFLILKQLDVQIIPSTAFIAGQRYSSGFGGGFKTTIFGQEVDASFNIKLPKWSNLGGGLTISGSLAKLSYPSANPVFVLKRPAECMGKKLAGITDGGAAFEINLTPRKFYAAGINGCADLELFGLTMAATLFMDKTQLKAMFDFKVGDQFDLDGALNLNTKDLGQSSGSFSLKNSFNTALAKSIQDVAKKMDSDVIGTQLTQAANALDMAKRSADYQAYQAAQQFNASVEETNRQIQQCKNDWSITNPVPSSCLGVAKDFVKVGLNGVTVVGYQQTKAITSLMSSAAQRVTTLNTQLEATRIAQKALSILIADAGKAVSSGLNITKAQGTFNLQNFIQTGALPSFKCDVVIAGKTITINETPRLDVRMLKQQPALAKQYVESIARAIVSKYLSISGVAQQEITTIMNTFNGIAGSLSGLITK